MPARLAGAASAGGILPGPRAHLARPNVTPNQNATPAAGSRGAIDAAIKEAYEGFRYESRPCPTSTPVRLATMAKLMGLEAPDPSTARVLEVACGDGGNLVPMAAASPSARFVGIDIATGAVAEARAMAADLALGNIAFHAADLRDLPGDIGRFDYVVAHGFYSWVPAEVREAMFATLRSRLEPDGIAFVSHNVMPGCALRGVAWSLLRPHVAGIDDPARRIAEARSMARLMADAMAQLPGAARALAEEFREIAARADFALLHDDLAVVNHPVHLREIVAEAGSHGLAWLADADLYRHPAPAYGGAMNAWLAGVDRLTREHVVDHLRLRRYRESLFVHRERGTPTPPAPERLAPMHVAASNDSAERHASLPRAPAASDRTPAAAQRMLIDRLVDLHPATVPVSEAVSWIIARSDPGSLLAAPASALLMLLNACHAGAIVPFARPVRILRTAGAKPRAFAPARWQASRHAFVVNLRHEGVDFSDPVQRRLLPLVDGTRTRAELASELAAWVPDSPNPPRLLDDYVAHFAKIGLIEE